MTLHCLNISCSAELPEAPPAQIGTLTALGRYIRRGGWVLDDDGELWCGRCALEAL